MKKLGKLKIKIVKIYEKDGLLRVETETEFGKDNLGLSLEQKYKDPVTQEPRWKAEVRALLEAKYLKEKATPKDVEKESWGKEL